MSIRCLALIAPLALASTANAQSLDLGFACANETAGDTTSWTNGEGLRRCSIDYTNFSGADLTNVSVRFEVDTATTSGFATALPDGVPGLADSNNQTWQLFRAVSRVSGSPQPSWNDAAQTASFTIGDIPDNTSSEILFSVLPDLAFPAGSTEMRVIATINGTEDGSGIVHTHIWDQRGPAVDSHPIDRSQVDRHYVGGSRIYATSLANAHDNARLRVHLPYWDGAAWQTDDNFDSSAHTPVIAPADLAARLTVLGNTNSSDIAFDLQPGDLTAPTSGPNVGRHIIYDPDTNTLTGEFGPWWASESIFGIYHGHQNWRLRWDGPYNPSLPGSALVENTQIPVQTCVESDQTGAVLAGDVDWCDADATTLTADEVNPLSSRHVICPGFGNYGTSCTDEGHPYLPGSTGKSLFRFNNLTSLTGDGVFQAQAPGDSVSGRVVDISKILVGVGQVIPNSGFMTGNDAADDIRIFVTNDPADYTGSTVSTDVPSRDLPSSGTTWTECGAPASAADNTTVICDATLLAYPLADVEQFRVEIPNMRPQALALKDWIDNAEFEVLVDWTVHSDAPSTIDGGSTSQTDTTLSTLGVNARFDLDLTNGESETSLSSVTGEISTESKVLPCGVYPGSGNGSNYTQPPACRTSGYNGAFAVVNDVRTFSFGLQNAGTLPNVTGAVDMCVPVPVGVRFENVVDSGDRWKPAVARGPMSSNTSGAATLLDISEYSYTWTPDTADSTIAGELCVHIPDTTLTLAPEEVIAVHAVVRFIPGVQERVQFWYSNSALGTGQIQGQDAAGSAIEHDVAFMPGYYDISGVSRLETTSTMSPGSPVGPTTFICYDYEHDSHAFDNSNTPTLDPGWARLPSYDGVSYMWIPDATEADPTSLSAVNSATSTFSRTDSPDAIAVWVHTGNAPARGDASTLAANGWQQCATGANVCNAGTLSGLGLTPAEVRWVAVEYGKMEITDAEPRGTAPYDGNNRLNNVYTARICVNESGTGTASTTLRTVMETHTSNLLTVVAEPLDVIINPDCPDGQVQATIDAGNIGPSFPCDLIDDDCDGTVDEDTIVGDSCSDGVGECADSGIWECIWGIRSTSIVCSATPGTPSEELCDDLDQDCDGDPMNGFTINESCAIGEGACESDGTTVCSTDGTAVECDAVVIEPTEELCDTIDQDCDGNPTNGFPDVGSECTVGVGECATIGNWVCLTDGTGVECDALEGLAAAETCDGIDGDCDGTVDGTLLSDGTTVISACLDTDNDGYVDHTEYFTGGGLDYLNPDTDGDGVQDGTEDGLTEPELDGATDLTVFVPDADPTTTTDSLDADSDDDGLLDGSEDVDANGAVDVGVELDPNNPDTDGDDVYDGTESGLTAPENTTDTDTSANVYIADVDPGDTTNPLVADTDGDGLEDGVEDANIDGAVDSTETDPNDDDTDDDGLMDGTEDADQSGGVNGTETDPLNNDSDGDNIQDGTESGIDTPEGDDTVTSLFVPDADTSTQTDPVVADTDTGTVNDGVEDSNYNGAFEPLLGECNPLDITDDLDCRDSDGDGLSDLEEGKLGTDPFDDDTDNDCITDGNEVTDSTNPLNADSDGDGIQDGTESGVTGPQGNDTDTTVCVPDEDPTTTTDPLDDDTDDDCIIDGNEDLDADGSVDATETDPDDTDSDDDGLMDGLESGVTGPQGTGTDTDICEPDTDPKTTTDPLDDDSDDDGLTDGEEDADGDGSVDDTETDPNDEDTDGGGVNDGDEVDRGSDPLTGEDDFPVDEPPEQWAQGGLACQTGGGAPWMAFIAFGALFARRRGAGEPTHGSTETVEVQ
ncbi:MAG: hypothetical protein KC912_22350 [Proteobacteria bacterium]|nr:hypothetical protein [Pseudomonadota bacterium]